MKCIFSISGEQGDYYDMVRALVRSAKKHTALELYCIYDSENQKLANWLDSNSVTILKWTLTFLKDMVARYDGKTNVSYCRGMYLCAEIPHILKENNISDEYVLYVDVDTIFTGSVELNECKPEYLSCSPDWDIDDWSRYGTGVMVMNTVNLLKKYDEFLLHMQNHNYNFEYLRMGPCDQGAWNTFYNGKIDKLDPVYDWKPWWGINNNAKIIHFAGPKPHFVDYILNLTTKVKFSETEYLHKCLIDEHLLHYKFYLQMWKDL